MSVAAIRLLDPEVVAKIRAGEVIDRPAAVAKELVENAIDAGSRRIAVHVAAHAERLIRVQDDGLGMSREDALLALRRHATSKIERAEDLARVDSLGFRGEALASIAEVSRLTLSTRSADDLTGTQVEALGGTILQVSGVGRAVGTTVVVEDLFYNTPARLRFLKSRDAEIRALARAIWGLILTYPAVHWKLTVEGREDTELPSAIEPLERWEILYGRSAAESAATVDDEGGGIRIRGVLGAPEQARATRDHLTFAVNRRVVASPAIAAAVRQGYGNLLPPDRHPVALLLIEVDPGFVDVNVHPTKREVRFREEGPVFQRVRHAVEAALRRSAPAPISLVEDAADPAGDAPAGPAGLSGVETTPRSGTSARPALDGVAIAELFYAPGTAADVVRERDAGALEESLRAPEIPIWQLHERYLLAPIRGGLVIVDQHAAHERILYEDAIERLYAGEGPSQSLLFPRLLDLTPEELDALLRADAWLRKLGFEVELFGERQVAVRAVPAAVSEDAAIESLRHVLASVDTFDVGSEPPEEQVAKTFACHAAVRTGQALKPAECRALFDRLFATSLPQGDPHGRPTYVRISMEDLDRRFGRR